MIRAALIPALAAVLAACSSNPSTDEASLDALSQAPGSSVEPGLLEGRSNLEPNEVVFAFADLHPGHGAKTAEFPIDIRRHIGFFGKTGAADKVTLSDYVKLGALGSKARLYVRVKNIGGQKLSIMHRNLQTDDRWLPLQDYEPDTLGEHTDLALPKGSATGWSTVSVTFPTEQLALAQYRGTAQRNEFKLVADAAGERNGTVDVAVAWASVDFFAQAPVILVHGINDNQENAWSEYGPEIRRGGFVADTDVDFSGLADIPAPAAGGSATFNGSVADDVERIAARLRKVAADYGTTDVHLIGHSKGGLDLVNFLAKKYPAMKSNNELRVLTLQTLATPHGGSVSADIMQRSMSGRPGASKRTGPSGGSCSTAPRTKTSSIRSRSRASKRPFWTAAGPPIRACRI